MKQYQDSLNEKKNILSQYEKKSGNTLFNKDLEAEIYEKQDSIAKTDFVEGHSSEYLKTLLVIVPKSKLEAFPQEYVTALSNQREEIY